MDCVKMAICSSTGSNDSLNLLTTIWMRSFLDHSRAALDMLDGKGEEENEDSMKPREEASDVGFFYGFLHSGYGGMALRYQDRSRSQHAYLMSCQERLHFGRNPCVSSTASGLTLA